jgi:hypothetical protein
MIMAGKVFIATTSGVVHAGDQDYIFSKGVTRVREGHELLKAAPDYFEEVGDHVTYEVETATAGPGEKRGQPEPVKKSEPEPEPAKKSAAPTPAKK